VTGFANAWRRRDGVAGQVDVHFFHARHFRQLSVEINGKYLNLNSASGCAFLPFFQRSVRTCGGFFAACSLPF
jgi:hypothetical protein